MVRVGMSGVRRSSVSRGGKEGARQGRMGGAGRPHSGATGGKGPGRGSKGPVGAVATGGRTTLGVSRGCTSFDGGAVDVVREPDVPSARLLLCEEGRERAQERHTEGCGLHVLQ